MYYKQTAALRRAGEPGETARGAGMTVTELNRMISAALKASPGTQNVTVTAEVSGFKHHIASGHWYFSLKDAESAIACVMFRQNTLHGAQVRPSDGDSVTVTGYVDLYPRDGRLQLYVTSLKPAGAGSLYEQFEALKQMGCAVIQGYYFSKPVPAAEFEAFLTEKPEESPHTPKPEEPDREQLSAPALPEDIPDESSRTVISEISLPEKEEKAGKGVLLRKVSIFFAAAALICGLALFITDRFVTDGFLRMSEANERYIQAQDAAADLESASDYLTEKVRAFAVTGDPDYLTAFFEEVEVVQRRDQAVSRLEKLLQGNHQKALAYLSSALEISNELVRTEYLSMKFIVEAGDYPEERIPDPVRELELSPAEKALSAEEKRLRAIDLVFNEEYADKKAQIKAETALCTEDLMLSAEKEMAASNSAMEKLMTVQTLCTVLLLMVVFFMVLYLAFWVRRPLIRMVEKMKAKQYVQPDGAEELRFVARTYNEIYEENQETNERLTYETMHDALTGLLNRKAFQVFEQDIDTAHSALLIVDVDKFKAVNDSYGHQTGDKILARVAKTLQRSFRSSDMIFRIGGDEFVVIMTRADSSMRELVLNKIEQMNQTLKNPEDGLPPVSLSVGVAFGDRKNPQGDMLRDADTALFRVKDAGRCGCVIY